MKERRNATIAVETPECVAMITRREDGIDHFLLNGYDLGVLRPSITIDTSRGTALVSFELPLSMPEEKPQ